MPPAHPPSEDAEKALAEAIAAAGPTCTRHRAELLSALATAVTRQGRLDEGCGLAEESLSLAIGTGSAVGVERVRRFRRELDRWHDAVPVVRLDEHLVVA